MGSFSWPLQDPDNPNPLQRLRNLVAVPPQLQAAPDPLLKIPDAGISGLRAVPSLGVPLSSMPATRGITDRGPGSLGPTLTERPEVSKPAPDLASLPAAQGGAGSFNLLPLGTQGARVQQAAASAALAMPDVQQAPNLGGLKPLAPVLPDARPANILNPNSPQGRLGVDQSELARLNQTGSGVDQIKTPWLRGFAKIGDGLLDTVAPHLAQNLPGTELYHQRLVGQAQQRIGQDQGELTSAANLQDLQAQGQQRQALAVQEQAKAQALSTPRPNPGQLMYDKNGSPIGYQDGEGNYFGPQDPTLPQGVRDVLGAAQRKQPTNAFELWQQQNPKGAAEDYLKLELEGKNKPLDQQLIEAESSGNTAQAATIRHVIQETKVQPRIDVHTATAPAPAAGGFGGSGAPGQNSPMVQAIIDGRAPAPSLRSKQGMALMQAVAAADPTYDSSRYNTYQAMQKEVTSGKTGQNINSLNTVLSHIADARQNLPQNGSIPLLNTLSNAGATAFGRNPTGKFDVDASGIAGEFGKLVNGGVATQGELEHLQKLLGHNGSPQQLSQALDEIENLAKGKLTGIQRQVESAMHPGPGSHEPSSLPNMGGGGASMVTVQIPGMAPGQIPRAALARFQQDHPNGKVGQ